MASDHDDNLTEDSGSESEMELDELKAKHGLPDDADVNALVAAMAQTSKSKVKKTEAPKTSKVKRINTTKKREVASKITIEDNTHASEFQTTTLQKKATGFGNKPAPVVLSNAALFNIADPKNVNKNQEREFKVLYRKDSAFLKISMSGNVINGYEVRCYCGESMQKITSGKSPYFKCIAKNNTSCNFTISIKGLETMITHGRINLDVAQKVMLPRVKCPNESCVGYRLYNYSAAGLEQVSLLACSCNYKNPQVKVQLTKGAAKLADEPNCMVKKLCMKEFTITDEKGNEISKPFFNYQNFPTIKDIQGGASASAVTINGDYDEE